MTVFLTTHYMEEAEALCGRVAIIDGGRIVVLGSPAELKGNLPGKDIVTLAVEDLSPGRIGEVEALPFVRKVVAEGGSLRVYVDQGAKNLSALIDGIRGAGGAILSTTIHEQSLEDVFIHYTGKSIREEEARKVNFLVGAGLPPKWGGR
jgi:ABC-2 type transport system ATP-binding protein